jgi:hypothetical protein
MLESESLGSSGILLKAPNNCFGIKVLKLQLALESLGKLLNTQTSWLHTSQRSVVGPRMSISNSFWSILLVQGPHFEKHWLTYSLNSFLALKL